MRRGKRGCEGTDHCGKRKRVREAMAAAAASEREGVCGMRPPL
jgi:hypothetical protein